MFSNLIPFVEKTFNLKVKGMFNYGSFVMKYKKPDDFDFIVISNISHPQEAFIFEDKKIEISFYSFNEFIEKLNNHEIQMFECINIPEGNDYINFKDDSVAFAFNHLFIDKTVLRKSISSKVSNSYVKAKKKLILKDDFDIDVSMKSLWHSFRIVSYGIQIAEFGRIVDFQCSNDLFKEISEDYFKISQFESPEYFWNFIHSKYKPIHNRLTSEFKMKCPKS